MVIKLISFIRLNKYKYWQMESSSTYITEAPIQPDNSLRAYVNVLDAKMDYAKWKQKLVLSYNYMPLANIKDKLYNDRISYMKKMEAEEARLRALVDNEEITTLLAQLHNFRAKLLQNAEKTEKKIEEQKLVLHKLKQVASSRKQALKNILRNNKQLVIVNLKNQGIKSTRDLKSLMRSKSTLTNTGSYTTRITTKQQKYPEPAGSHQNLIQTYQTCLQSIRKQRQQNTTHDSYKHSKTKSQINENANNYQSVPLKMEKSEIQWQQFANLNPTQIISLLNQRDPSGRILHNLLMYQI